MQTMNSLTLLVKEVVWEASMLRAILWLTPKKGQGRILDPNYQNKE